MRRFIFGAAVLVATATSALAQTATQDVNLSATVAGFCTIDGSNTGAARSATVTPTTNGQVAAGSVTITGSDSPVVCNQNTRIQLRSAQAGLTGPGSPTGSFINKIHYTATATANAVTESINTTSATANVFTSPGTSSTAGAFSGVLALSISTLATPSGSYLLPGSYSDTLTVQLTPVP